MPRLMKISLLAALALNSTGIGNETAQASDLQAGACYQSLGSWKDAMQAEGQHSLMYGNPILGNFESEVVTFNTDGSIGYRFGLDKPIDTAGNFDPGTSKICLSEQFADLTIFDPAKEGVDPQAKIEGNRALAAQLCQSLSPPDPECGYHDDRLAVLNKRGIRVAFQANHVKSTVEADGSRETLDRATMLMNPIRMDAELDRSSASGAIQPLVVFRDLHYSTFGKQLLANYRNQPDPNQSTEKR